MSFNAKSLMAGVLSGICGVVLLGSLPRQNSPPQAIESPHVESQPRAISTPNCVPEHETQASEITDHFEKLAYKGYVIETRQRTATIDVPPEYGPPPKPVKISYVVVRRKEKLVAMFDGDIYFPLGNSAEAGLFPLLGNGTKQLIVSQDVPRTGLQWVADFSKGFKIVFDGRKFLAGREGGDMTISDLDGDGVQEITVPITAFYGFEQWRLTTSETPLPAIVFKYDQRLREYLPSNSEFKDCLLREVEEAERRWFSNEPKSLGRLMSVSLDYIFLREEQRGWKFFEEACTLPDKARIKMDMQKVLEAHPVYQYLRRHSKRQQRLPQIRTIEMEYQEQD